jgi:hypothetical protein
MPLIISSFLYSFATDTFFRQLEKERRKSEDTIIIGIEETGGGEARGSVIG